jgi:predicted alpha/beta-fold hydrolase
LRNRHAQTIWGPLFRRGGVPLRRERVATRDGDFVDLDWIAAPAPAGAPLLLLLHGLEGSCQSHYARGVLSLARAEGWRAVMLNFRSCSGEPNRLPRFYHSGDTDDLDEVVRLLVEREPALSIVSVGVSLGGNVLLKWLGEQGESAPTAVRAAVGISVPFYLEPCARALDRGFQKWVYTANFMRTFKQKVRAKASVHGAFVDLEAVRRARTFAAYDRVVTAPLHGFADEVDYWRRASCGPYLPKVARPALLLNALDDPFVPAAGLPDPSALPAHVRLELTERGGHVGFVEGPPWRVTSWAERRAVKFLRGVLDGGLC